VFFRGEDGYLHYYFVASPEIGWHHDGESFKAAKVDGGVSAVFAPSRHHSEVFFSGIDGYPHGCYVPLETGVWTNYGFDNAGIVTLNTEAFAKDAFIQGSPVDHTYVVCNDSRFPCFGGDTGGHSLSDTQGYNDLAKVMILNEDIHVTLTLPLIGDVFIRTDAGIIYAVNGVCHIASNRLMVQSRKTVASARGSKQSFALFGVYGTKVPGSVMEFLLDVIGKHLPGWARELKGAISAPGLNVLRQQLERQLQTIWLVKLNRAGLSVPVNAFRAMVQQDGLSAGKEEAILSNLAGTDQEDNDDVWTNFHRSEMETVWKDFLGKDFDQDKLADLVAIQEESQEGRHELRRLRAHHDEETLSDQINLDAENLSRQIREILSADEYSRLVGGNATAPTKIADPEVEKVFFAQPGRISFRPNDANSREAG
jgi:hypothetical protein